MSRLWLQFLAGASCGAAFIALGFSPAGAQVTGPDPQIGPPDRGPAGAHEIAGGFVAPTPSGYRAPLPIFDFDDATIQGWTLEGAFVDTVGGPFASDFTLSWEDSVSYPNPSGLDPLGDNAGALNLQTVGGHGITEPGTYWTMRLRSPGLRCEDEWQTADGFSVRVSESMGVFDSPVLANLVVRIFDIEQQTERFFVNGSAQILTHDVYGDAVAVWDSLAVDFTTTPDFPTNYIVEDIFVNIWGELVGTYDGRVFLDDVVPFGGTGSVAELLLVPGDFPDLLSAVDAACSGDTIEIADGTYSGAGFQNVDFQGKALHIRSASGDPSLCVIDAGGDPNDGLTLTTILGPSTITGLTIENARTAVRCTSAQLTIDRCVLRNNSQFGASASGAASLTVTNSTIADNSNRGIAASMGGSIVAVDSCLISGNAGGGLSIAEGSLTVTNSVITGNVATQGAGIAVTDGFATTGSAIVRDCTLSGNRTIAGDGGGVLVRANDHGASVTLERTIIWGNCATTGPQTDEVWVVEDGAGAASATLTCCVVNAAGVGGTGTINQTQVVDASPLFCGAIACEDAPTSAGEYTVHADSPCLPGVSPCGQLIGARGQGCACDDDGILRVPSEYTSIQAAVDFACDGDTVVVDSTAYDLDPENVVVAGKTIGIRALGGRVSMLSLGWDSPGAVPTGGFLQGFSISGDFTGSGDFDLPFTMDDCTVSGTTRIDTNPGGAFSPELTVTSCVFQDTARVAQSNLLAAGQIISCRVENAPLISAGKNAFIEDCTVTSGDLYVSGEVVTVTGCTVTGGTLRVDVDTQGGTVDSCTVTGGVIGGILVTANGANVSVEDNRVEGCSGAGIGMSANLSSSSSVFRNIVLDCENGIVTSGDNLEIRRNVVSRCGDGVATNGASLDVLSNTIVGGTGAGIRFADGPAFGSCRHNLVVLNDVGVVAPAGTDGSALENNDVWGNVTADWSGVADQTGLNCNISADPLLCDAAADDYGLAAASPCRPGNHPGCPTLIGAVASACPEVLVDVGDGVRVSEAGSTSDAYTVTLATAPVGDVEVVVSWDSTQVAVDPSSVILNLTNWQAGVPLTVTAVDDSLDEVGDHITGLTHAIGGATTDPIYVALTGLPGVSVTIADDDTSEVIVDVGDGVSVSEAGPTSDSYTIALATEPIGDVQVDIAWDPTEVGVSPANVILDATNWRVGVSVDVTAVDDDEAEGAHQTSLTHVIGVGTTDTLYANLTDLPEVTVSIADDDTAGVLVDIGDGVAVSETGTTSDSYTITLTTAPSGSVEVAVAWDSTQVTVAPPSVILNLTNWQTGVAVGVTAVDDEIDEGGDHLTAITHAIGPGTTDPLYAPLIDLPQFGVTIADDDTANVIVDAGDGVTVSEVGTTSDSYTITLATEPVGDVQVDVAWDSAQVDVAPSSVILDSTNWESGIAVVVTALDDAIDEGGDHGTDLTHAIGVGTTDPFYTALIDLPVVTATIADDDTAAVLVSEGDGVSVSENGPTSDSYTITLATEPTGDVQIDVSWDSAQVDADPFTVVLNPANWQIGVAVGVTAVDDPFDEGGDHGTDLTHAIGVGTLDPIYSALAGLPAVTATISDNDTTAVIADAGDGVSVSEAGISDSYTIRLATRPTGDVQVDVSWDTGQVDVTPASVVLDSTNWAAGLSVDVTAVDDDEAEGAHATLLTHALGVGTTDLLYGALTEFPEVTVAIADDDSAGVFVNTGSGVEVSETGPTSDAYVITLTTEPAGEVEVTVSWDATQVDVDRTRVILDATNWQAGVIVRVTAIDDPLDEGDDHTTSITHAIGNGTTDPVYAGLTDLPGVSVTIADNDDAAVIADVADGVAVSEAGPTTDRYTLRLATAPTATVEVDVSWDATQVDVDPPSVILDPTNWQTGVLVAVTAVDDVAAEGDHQVNLGHAIGDGTTDPAYAALANLPDVAVTIADNDNAAVLVDVADGVSVSEAGPTTDPYTIRLATVPVGVVEVEMTWAASQIDVDPPSVLLDALNWDTGVIVNVTAVDDAAVEGSHGTDIAHGIGGQTTDPVYALLSALPEVAVAITDNDAPPDCQLVVTSPGQDVSWENGEIRTIEWQSTNCGGQVEIGLYAESADTPCQRVTTSDTGSYDWFVFGCDEGTGTYQVRVTDTVSGAFAESATFQIVPTPIESMTLALPTIPRSAYELWSVPMDLEGVEVPTDARLSDLLREVFDRDLGSSTWRGFALVDSLISDPPMVSGRGYWVNSTIPIPADYDVTGGVTRAVSLPLAAGWNTVGTPSHEPIPLSSLRVRTVAGDAMTLGEAAESSVISGVTWDYVDDSGDLINNGRWVSTDVTTDADLIPWTAVLVRAFEPAELLFGSPDIPPVARREPLFDDLTWSLQIAARSGSLLDQGVEVGASPEALPGFDVLDLPKPPLPGGGFELSVVHTEWDRFSGRYVRSVGPDESDEHRWSLELRGGDDEAQLSWTGIESIPDQLFTYLILPGGAAVPMSEQSTFTTPIAGSIVLDVLVTGEPWNGPLITSGFNGVLGVAPRPFNGDRMRITYQIATGPVDARLRLFDVRGRLVRDFGRIEGAVGTWVQPWDGRTDTGLSVGSGLYFFELRLGAERHTIRQVVVR